MDSPEQDVARVLAHLAERPTPRHRPVLVVLCGLPGSGKSTVAHALHERTGAVVVRSDVIRKLLAPEPAYSSEESSRVFAAVNGAVERLLHDGISVIQDSTNLKAHHRRRLLDIADRCRARAIVVWVDADEAEIRRRLTARVAGTRAAYDVSDAGVDVYEWMRAEVEPLEEPHITVRTDRDLTSAVDELARWMEASITAV